MSDESGTRSSLMWTALAAIGGLMSGIAAVLGLFIAKPDTINILIPQQTLQQAGLVQVTAPPGGVGEAGVPSTRPPGASYAAPAVTQEADLAPPLQSHMLQGRWSGTIRQGALQYDLLVDFSAVGDESVYATIQYPGLACSGIWQGQPGSASAGGPWQAREIIQQRGQGCINGVVDLASLADGSLLMDWRQRPGGQVLSNGVLRRTN
jgi:hypothetical protein